MTMQGPLRVGIGGPVGAGKTTLTEMLCKDLSGRLSMAVKPMIFIPPRMQNT